MLLPYTVYELVEFPACWISELGYRLINGNADKSFIDDLFNKRPILDKLVIHEDGKPINCFSLKSAILQQVINLAYEKDGPELDSITVELVVGERKVCHSDDGN